MKRLMLGLAVLAGSATPVLAFDARNPADVLEVLKQNGASGELKSGEDGPFIEAKAGTEVFSVEFYRCNAKKTECDLLTYRTWWDFDGPTVEEVNAWNAWTLVCPAYLDGEKRMHAWQPVSVRKSTTEAELAAAQEDWLGCLDSLDDLAQKPAEFIKSLK